MAAINRILCPIDLSETSRHALDHAFAFGRWYEARITVLHVLNVPLPVMPPTGIPEGLSGIPRFTRTTSSKRSGDSAA
jgi:nucleotide-binding universal stress UspA family protein